MSNEKLVQRVVDDSQRAWDEFDKANVVAVEHRSDPKIVAEHDKLVDRWRHATFHLLEEYQNRPDKDFINHLKTLDAETREFYLGDRISKELVHEFGGRSSDIKKNSDIISKELREATRSDDIRKFDANIEEVSRLMASVEHLPSKKFGQKKSRYF